MASKKILTGFEIILILLIIFTPLFYGSVEKIKFSLAQSSVIILFLAITLIASLYRLNFFYPKNTGVILVVLILAVFQIIYLPNYLIKIISPNTYFLYQKYQTGFTASGFSHLSIYSLSTIEEIVKFISFFLFFLCILNILKKRRQFERIILVIIFLSFALSIFGIIKNYFYLGRQFSDSFSTFGNRNHFAAYMIMTTLVTVGYAVSRDNRFKKIIFGFLAAVMYATVFLSLSRGGSVCLTISLVLFVLIVSREKIAQNKNPIVMISIISIIVLLLLAGVAPDIKERFFSTKWSATKQWSVTASLAGRLSIYQDSLSLIKDINIILYGS